jgi:hypothetical protein
MAGTCENCGQWLDDIESGTVPQHLCWDCKPSGGEGDA